MAKQSNQAAATSLTFESALRHYRALLRWLTRLHTLSLDLRYVPYTYEKAEEKLRSVAAVAGMDEYIKIREKVTQKLKEDLPTRVRFSWAPGNSPIKHAMAVNDVCEAVERILKESRNHKVVLDVPIIVADNNADLLMSGTDDFSKGSIAWGLYNRRILWYDEVNQVPFWLLRKDEGWRLQKVLVDTMIPWAQEADLPQCLDESEDEARSSLTKACIFMRPLPGTNIGDLDRMLITWGELSEAVTHAQYAVSILAKCIMIGNAIANKNNSYTDIHSGSPDPKSTTNTLAGRTQCQIISKKKKRPTKNDMANRNKIVAYAAGDFKLTYEQLPTVDDIARETKLTPQQIYATNAYKNGKVRRNSAKVPDEMVGGSVSNSEHYGQESEQRGREVKKHRDNQDEVDALIDEQGDDAGSRYVPSEKKS